MDVQIDIKKVTFGFNEEKNLLLKETRGISFDEIIKEIKNGNVLDNLHNKNYLKQKIMVVKLKNYVYAVPYIINQEKKTFFLKTIYPSRDLTRKYLKRI